MKIIDKTPLQNENGEIEFFARLRGTLKYGFSWYSELQAQQAVIAKLDRLLERGFVLIRNFTLPGSEIVIPIVLIGPGGVQVIHVTHAKGFFEAKGDQWNTINNGRSQPASINLLSRAMRFSRAFQVYLQRQRMELPCPIEPVLIAENPGAHIESLRPVTRVVKSDAINAFAASLLQARPVLRTDYIHELADYIVNPRPLDERRPQASPEPSASAQDMSAAKTSAPSRAKAIFEAAQSAEPINPAELEFAFEEGPGAGSAGPSNLRQVGAAQPLSSSAALQKGRLFGMRTGQVAVLTVMLIVECCVLAAFGYLFTLNQ